LNITTEATEEDINKRLREEGNKTKGNKTKGNKTKGNKTKTNNYLYKYNSALSPSEP
jgi:hypothetical protein